jgi:hypothetical protein
MPAFPQKKPVAEVEDFLADDLVEQGAKLMEQDGKGIEAYLDDAGGGEEEDAFGVAEGNDDVFATQASVLLHNLDFFKDEIALTHENH